MKKKKPNDLEIIKPDDWHVHFRDDAYLIDTVSATAKHFKRALAMPNLKPALTSLDLLLAYRDRILHVLPNSDQFIPYTTFYLNEQLTPETLIKAKPYPFILGAKLYPAGVTTHSEQGVHSLKKIYPLLDIMQEQSFVLQIHGETIKDDIFTREKQFLKKCLVPIIRDFPKLRIVLEHISTREAVSFILDAPDHVAATITPHHLLFNRNDLLSGGIRPHYYCLPILKSPKDQIALNQAAASGHPKFFAGTDSAPHAIATKESACGCAGIYSAPYALALYAQAFEKIDRLAHLEGFVSRFGADFYQLPRNQEKIYLTKSMETIPKTLPLGSDQVVPIAAGSCLDWSVYEA